MRVVHAQGYHEPRDALSQDWFPFLAACGITPVLVPNIGENAQAFAAEMNVAGLLLTGGNNVCPQTYGGAPEDTVNDMAPERDNTETTLIHFALENNLPILGVCRGMHMLNAHFGGKILTSIKEQVPNAIEHVANDHDVRLEPGSFLHTLGIPNLRVNSFHNQGLTDKELASPFHIAATTPADGVIEALYHPHLPIFGIEWHPERPNPASELDLRLVTRIFVDRSLSISVVQGT